MTEKTREEKARELAEFDALYQREQALVRLRAGNLSHLEAERLTAELCAEGDARKRVEAERIEKESRERGARIRAGITS